jgi:hypothetical protein
VCKATKGGKGMKTRKIRVGHRRKDSIIIKNEKILEEINNKLGAIVILLTQIKRFEDEI